MAEHALMGYITGQAFIKESVDLYFAFKKGENNTYAKPYYFSAEKEERHTEFFEDTDSLEKIKITFSGIF